MGSSVFCRISQAIREALSSAVDKRVQSVAQLTEDEHVRLGVLGRATEFSSLATRATFLKEERNVERRKGNESFHLSERRIKTSRRPGVFQHPRLSLLSGRLRSNSSERDSRLRRRSSHAFCQRC